VWWFCCDQMAASIPHGTHALLPDSTVSAEGFRHGARLASITAALHLMLGTCHKDNT